MEFTVVRGDIAEASADALANAAGTSLRDVRFIAHSSEEYGGVSRVADAVRAEAG